MTVSILETENRDVVIRDLISFVNGRLRQAKSKLAEHEKTLALGTVRRYSPDPQYVVQCLGPKQKEVDMAKKAVQGFQNLLNLLEGSAKRKQPKGLWLLRRDTHLILLMEDNPLSSVTELIGNQHIWFREANSDEGQLLLKELRGNARSNNRATERSQGGRGANRLVPA